jgi:hypothetical protein
MEPTITTQPQPKPNRHILLKIIVSVVVLLIIAGATVLIARTVHQANLEGDVKNEVIKQNKFIKASAKNNVYSPTLPAGVKTTDKVIIDATVSASGTTYCIAGTSKVDAKIVFHMDKSTPEDQPAKGSCSEGVTVPPTTPPDVAVGSFGAGVVNLTWGKTPFALSYTAQCATDKDFVSGLTSKITNDTFVTMDGLTGNTHYYCRVAAGNNLGQSEWSSTLDAVTNAVSVAPTDLKITTISQSELGYSFKPAEGATAYVLQYSTDINFQDDVVNVTINTTSGSVKGLKTATAYLFHVKAVTAGFDAPAAAFSDTQLGRTAE